MIVSSPMNPVIIGTAGHIDHGKTALVKALTGTNTDRLKEEQERGITIELGYAFLTERIAFIDVPGHERFIKNMVAGVATVDFALLVIAADDGIMPQTREHFDILRLLGVPDGAVAITKCALADDDWIDLVEEEVKEMLAGSFLEGRTIVRVDSLSGSGIEDLKEKLVEMSARKKEQPPGSIFRLPIDRVFTIKGFGTVVTGSALSGTIAVEDHLELLPRGNQVRVRGIQTQGYKADSATAGMRVAVNVPQVAVEDVSRGDVLVTPARLKPTFMIDTECRVLKSSPIPLLQRQRIRLHIGTKEVMARAVLLDQETIEPGESGLVQFRLESPIAAQRLDRYVIRRYSPQLTIGGGRILDAAPDKHRKRHAQDVISTLQHFGDGESANLLLKILDKEKVLSFDDLVARSGLTNEQVEDDVAILGIDGQIVELEAKGIRRLCSSSLFKQFRDILVETLEKYHKKNPLRAGAKRGEILSRWKKELPDFLIKHFLDLCLAGLVVKSSGGDVLALHEFDIQLTKKQRSALLEIDRSLEKGAFQPDGLADLSAARQMPEKEIRTLLQVLVDQGKAINLEGKIYFHTTAVARGIEQLRSNLKPGDEISMSEFRTLIGTSRKYALPLLNYYDNKGYTARRNDVRVPGPRLHSD
jgi:selenocysteine-specific elongation factor